MGKQNHLRDGHRTKWIAVSTVCIKLNLSDKKLRINRWTIGNAPLNTKQINEFFLNEAGPERTPVNEPSRILLYFKASPPSRNQ